MLHKFDLKNIGEYNKTPLFINQIKNDIIELIGTIDSIDLIERKLNKFI